MKLSAYTENQLQHYLRANGLYFRTGPFTIRLQSHITEIQQYISEFYSDCSIAENQEFADFHIRVDYPTNLRRWVKSQVYFYLDGRVPFKPLPSDQAVPMLEWGMNWCIANHAHQYLIVHAAALEKNGCGILLPAQPGSGKSTLAAALMARGWRLLSDELGIVNLIDKSLVPLSRPVNLKNQSIEIIRQYARPKLISRPFHDTNKGTVSLVAPPVENVDAANQSAQLKCIINLQYQEGVTASLSKFPKSRMFMHVADNSFNYSLLAGQGFDVLSDVIETCDCYSFTYSKLDDAVTVFDGLVNTANV